MAAALTNLTSASFRSLFLSEQKGLDTLLANTVRAVSGDLRPLLFTQSELDLCAAAGVQLEPDTPHPSSPTAVFPPFVHSGVTLPLASSGGSSSSSSSSSSAQYERTTIPLHFSKYCPSPPPPSSAFATPSLRHVHASRLSRFPQPVCVVRSNPHISL
jgi:hypothetical protein